MRNFRLPLFILLTSVAAIFSPRHAQALTVENFAGDYGKHGAMSISDGSGARGSGEATLRFVISPDGKSGRLNISGFIEMGDTDRPFKVGCVFRQKGIALITNLAPGIDDGIDSRGAYKASHSKITAKFPVDFGNVTGEATIEIRLTKRTHSARLEVTQTLSTSAIARPIVWKFSGASSR
jgi:hypothetical protein